MMRSTRHRNNAKQQNNKHVHGTCNKNKGGRVGEKAHLDVASPFCLSVSNARKEAGVQATKRQEGLRTFDMEESREQESPVCMQSVL